MVGPAGLTLPERAAADGVDALVACDDVLRIYHTEAVEIQTLQGLDRLVNADEMVAIVGASGSGSA